MIRPLPIDPKLRRQFQAIGQRIIPRRPDDAVLRARRNAQVVERKIVLLIQANRRLRAIFFLVKEPEKLPVIFPIPAGIVHVGEAFIFDLVRDFVERRENIRSTAGFSGGDVSLSADAKRECA